MKQEQLNIFVEVEKQIEREKPYQNGLGQLLPWEEPEYLASCQIDKIANSSGKGFNDY